MFRKINKKQKFINQDNDLQENINLKLSSPKQDENFIGPLL